MAELDVELDPKQFAAMMKVIKDIDPAIARAVQRELDQAGKAMAGLVRSRILEPPPGGRRSKGRARPHDSRRQLAAGVSHSVSTSGRNAQVLSVIVSDSKLPAERRPWAKAYNTDSWRHPVWGNRRVFVKQRGNPYFSDTKEPQRLAQAAMDRAVSEIANQLH